MHDLAQILEAGSKLGSTPAALATVVRTRGSTYRRAGARMLVTADGNTIGAVSGGCLESEVAARARGVIASGEPCLLAFDTRRMLGCHGVIEILVERVTQAETFRDVLGLLARRRAAREACVVATVFDGTDTDAPRLGSYCLETDDGNPLPRETREDGRAALAAERSARCSYAWGECFFDVIQPPIRLVIIGVGHDVVPLASLGRSLGWEVSVVAHPGERSHANGLAGATGLNVASPAALAADLRPDAFTAVVLMTHHFGRDLAFLDALLPRPLPYLGLLGPCKRREQLLAELAERRGFLAPAALSKLRSPIGLDLGAESPEEIALSIAAEIRAALAGRTARPLRECKGPIHADPCAPAERMLHRLPA